MLMIESPRDAADAEGWLEDMRQQLGWDGSESAPPFCGFDGTM